ncbi:DUF302 domain-containing protein [Streptacidiphilus sp. 4-A2]|nr:DUF302 domain-containing protein [Streptacidiphilus sp. 4-A2]
MESASPAEVPNAAPGTVTVRSRHSVEQTVAELADAIIAHGLTLFASIDQAAAAREAGLTMNEMTLLVFGNPRAGTPAMREQPLIGLELPLKALVWADDQNRAWVSYLDTSELGHRFGVSDELVKPLEGAARLLEATLAG